MMLRSKVISGSRAWSVWSLWIRLCSAMKCAMIFGTSGQPSFEEGLLRQKRAAEFLRKYLQEPLPIATF